jgi:hypothetical protein
MAHLLCVNCYQKFDDEQSYTVFEITVPAYLTKSRHEEALSLHRPICPNCGATNELLSMEAMRTKTRAGTPAHGGMALGVRRNEVMV